MMNRDEKSAYNRAYRLANKARIEANRAARRSGLGDETRRCSVAGCDGVYDAQGFCARHYMAFRRNGDPITVRQIQYHGKTWQERFWLYVDKGSECWTWTGLRNAKGYGTLRVGGRYRLTHRLSYSIAHGPIPDGLFVLHRCDNPACVQPKHLWLGTKAENNSDMDAKGRRRSNPPKGSKSPNAKLDEATVRIILASTERGDRLANRYDVSDTIISAIRHRHIWKHVK